MYGPVLTGEKVTLRPPRADEAKLFIGWFADTQVTRYMLTRFPPALYQEEEILKKLGESKDDVFWVIEADGRAVGATGIHGIDWMNAHGTTGIIIGDRSCWGRGYASEAMRIRTRYAFRELNLHKLKSSAFADNAASRRALEKAGYREIGVAREDIWREGRWHDHWLAEVLRADWERENA